MLCWGAAGAGKRGVVLCWGTAGVVLGNGGAGKVPAVQETPSGDPQPSTGMVLVITCCVLGNHKEDGFEMFL